MQTFMDYVAVYVASATMNDMLRAIVPDTRLRVLLGIVSVITLAYQWQKMRRQS